MAFFESLIHLSSRSYSLKQWRRWWDTSHLSIIVFSLLIGGLVGIISKNGGMMAIVHRIARVAKTAKSALISTWLMGLAIFFDDYSNTLVVGSTMRPLADKLKISRAKLAYVVDSTAAPVAAIGLVTTWIGMQLSEVGKGIEMQDYVTIGASSIQSLFIVSSICFVSCVNLVFCWPSNLYQSRLWPNAHGRCACSNQRIQRK